MIQKDNVHQRGLYINEASIVTYLYCALIAGRCNANSVRKLGKKSCIHPPKTCVCRISMYVGTYNWDVRLFGDNKKL